MGGYPPCSSALLIGGLLAASISRIVTRPLESLVAGTRALGQGNFSYRFSAEEATEVRELGQAFDRMLSDLTAHHANKFGEHYKPLPKDIYERTILCPEREQEVLRSSQKRYDRQTTRKSSRLGLLKRVGRVRSHDKTLLSVDQPPFVE